MSYAMSAALQSAIYGRLSADTALGAIVGASIFDSPPTGALPAIYVTLGPETVRDRSDKSGFGAEHDVTISVVTQSTGFATAKAAAASISDALLGTSPPDMSRGRIVSLVFRRARAVRATPGDERRIDLIFRARLDDDN